ncbi:MAG: hypothetical protein NZ550_04025 [Fimbriimonadales bacterium]|nr:hypothetical protein [Fimbriimonadales bacterium]MDW8051486.1 hypothetical protein [Armatimonadota bacterium]
MRFAEPKYNEVIISPVGLVYLELETGTERRSIYIGDIHTSGVSEVEILGQQSQLYQPGLLNEILAQPKETFKLIDEVNRFYTRGSKMSVFWTSHNLATETVHEAVSKAVSSAIQERNERLSALASALKSELADAVSILFASAYGIVPNREVDIFEVGRALQADVGSLLGNLGISHYSRAVVRVAPGVVIGFLDRFAGLYRFGKVDLDRFEAVHIGSIDVRSAPKEVWSIKLK